jgi:hypothetical protein
LQGRFHALHQVGGPQGKVQGNQVGGEGHDQVEVRETAEPCPTTPGKKGLSLARETLQGVKVAPQPAGIDGDFGIGAFTPDGRATMASPWPSNEIPLIGFLGSVV